MILFEETVIRFVETLPYASFKLNPDSRDRFTLTMLDHMRGIITRKPSHDIARDTHSSPNLIYNIKREFKRTAKGNKSFFENDSNITFTKVKKALNTATAGQIRKMPKDAAILACKFSSNNDMNEKPIKNGRWIPFVLKAHPV